MITMADILVKMKKDLDWRGPGGKPMGHIVLTNEEALYLHDHVIELIMERDRLVVDAADLSKKVIALTAERSKLVRDMEILLAHERGRP